MKEAFTQSIITLIDYRYLLALVLFSIWLFIDWAIMVFFNKYAHKVAKRTKTEADYIILKEISAPLWGLLLFLGIRTIIQLLSFPLNRTFKSIRYPQPCYFSDNSYFFPHHYFNSLGNWDPNDFRHHGNINNTAIGNFRDWRPCCRIGTAKHSC